MPLAENRAVWAQSGTVAAASAVATLPASSGYTTYITGFEVSGAGSTAGGVILVTVAGLAAGTITYALCIPAGVLVPVSFPRTFGVGLPALISSVIVVTAPSFGAGNTNATVVAYGFQQ